MDNCEVNRSILSGLVLGTNEKRLFLRLRKEIAGKLSLLQI